MHITELHALARRELSALARARYMPRGYDRKASQQAERKHYELGRYLDDALAATPDCLLPYPPHAKLQALLTQAAEERTLRAMVVKMVELLAALPQMDQGDAHALADITDRLFSAEQVTAQAQTARAAFESLAGHARRLELDFSAVQAALQDLERQVSLKVDTLRDNERLLTETP